MHALKTTSAALGGIAVLLLVVVQFTPWANYHAEGGSFFGFSMPDSDIEAGTWKVTATAGGNAADESWYSEDAKDYSPGESDLTQIRIAIPTLLVAGLLALIGSLLTMVKQAAGPILCLAAGVVATAGTVLFGLGIEDFYGDAAQSWGPAYFLAIATCVLLVASGVLGLVAGNSRSTSSF